MIDPKADEEHDAPINSESSHAGLRSWLVSLSHWPRGITSVGPQGTTLKRMGTNKKLSIEFHEASQAMAPNTQASIESVLAAMYPNDADARSDAHLRLQALANSRIRREFRPQPLLLLAGRVDDVSPDFRWEDSFTGSIHAECALVPLMDGKVSFLAVTFNLEPRLRTFRS